MNFHYKILSENTEAEFKDKGSKFIAYAYPFTDETNLKPIIDQLKTIHPKARHHCFAYRIGNGNDNYRAFDDGEPSGSAGKPILNALLSAEISDTLIIVVRYFGGTLLGVPGLINAYKTAALLALENAKTEIKYLTKNVQFKFTFEHLNQIMRIIKDYNLKILSQIYDPDCTFILEIKQDELDEIIQKIEDYRAFEFEVLE